MFIYELSSNLKIPVREIYNMPYTDLLGWAYYVSVRPFGWREDDRAFKFIQTQGFKGKPYEIFPSLQAIYNYVEKQKEIDSTKLNMNTFKNSMMFKKISSAKGGAKIDFYS